MSDLTPEDRALLDLAREAHEPTAADRSRVRTALIAQLGVSTGLTAAAAASSSTAAAGIAGITSAAGVATAGGAATVASGGGAAVAATSTMFVLAAKVLTAVGIAGAVAGGGVAAHRALHAPQALMTVSAQIPSARNPLADLGAAPSARESVAPPAPSKATETEVVTTAGNPPHPKSASASPPTREAYRTTPRWAEASPSFADPLSITASPVASQAPAAPAAPAGEMAAPPVMSESEVAVTSRPLSPTTLEAETRLVRAAVAALHEHDPARALVLLNEHARSYPSGALAEERAAARVNALCDLGQTDNAQAAAAAFLRDRPSSPLAARVRTACLTPHGGRTNP